MSKLTDKDYQKISSLPFKMAKISNQFDSVRVIVGTNEIICGEEYMTALVKNNRVAKFRTSVLEYFTK